MSTVPCGNVDEFVQHHLLMLFTRHSIQYGLLRSHGYTRDQARILMGLRDSDIDEIEQPLLRIGALRNE
jgi:hypothetical protein